MAQGGIEREGRGMMERGVCGPFLNVFWGLRAAVSCEGHLPTEFHSEG